MDNSRRPLTAGYAVFTLLFLCGLIVFLYLRIDFFSDQNKKYVAASLENVSYELKERFAFSGGFFQSEIKPIFERALRANSLLLVIALTTPQPQSGIIAVEAKSRNYVANAGAKNESADGWLKIQEGVQYYKKPDTAEYPSLTLVLSHNNREARVNLGALYASFSTDNALILLQEIFYAFSGFFCLTLLLIIVTALIFRKRNQAATSVGVLTAEDLEPMDLSGETGRRKKAVFPGEPAFPGEKPTFPDSPTSFKNEPGWEEKPVIEESSQDLVWNEEERMAQKRAHFNPETGLARGELFRERLSHEIERAVSFSDHLSLMLVSVSVSPPEKIPWRERFAPAAREIFKNLDLVYEYGEETAAVVAPGLDLDAAIRSGKALYKKLFAYAWRASVGITSRNGRVPTPTSFIEEATRALRQAESGGQSPIVVFRSESPKIQNYLSPR